MGNVYRKINKLLYKSVTCIYVIVLHPPTTTRNEANYCNQSTISFPISNVGIVWGSYNDIKQPAQPVDILHLDTDYDTSICSSMSMSGEHMVQGNLFIYKINN